MYSFLTPCDFLQQMESRSFDVPEPKHFVHIYAGLWIMSIQWYVFQLDVELHLLVEDLISSVSAEAYEKLYLVLSDFLPLLLSFGEKSGLSGTSTLSDTLLQEYRIQWHLVISKCMWQICNVLQIYDSLNF